MLKCLAVVDKSGSAIDGLTKTIAERNPQLNMRVLAVHPKRPDADSLRIFEKEMQQADLILWAYWKTAEMLRERFPEAKSKRSILVHHNPYNLLEKPWTGYNKIIVKNKSMQKTLPLAEVIEHGIETDSFPWHREYKVHATPRVGMVAARIEGKKGILEVAQACAKIGAQFVLVGRISDEHYFMEVSNAFENRRQFEFHCDISQTELVRIYQSMDCLVVNSVDDFESGPLPALEAMSCGVPVLARKGIGYFPDIDQDAFWGMDQANDDIDALARQIDNLLKDEEQIKTLRSKGWNVAKYRDSRYMARRFEGVINEVLFEKPMVSVIIPTHNRHDVLFDLIKSMDQQTYKALEIVVCDDGSDPAITLDMIAPLTRYPVKLVHTHDTGYGLAKARNLGAIEASGEYFLFLDDRHTPDKHAIETFVDSYHPNEWLYGKKDGVSKEFVENFSFIHRQDFFDFGMFCERIREYGGMSQETRVRATKFGMKLKEIDANAESTIKTKSRETKKNQIVHSKYLLWLMGK